MKKYDVLNSNEEVNEDSIVLNSEENLKKFITNLDVSFELIKRTETNYILRHQKDIGFYNSLSNYQESLKTVSKLASKVEDRGGFIDFYFRLEGQVV